MNLTFLHLSDLHYRIRYPAAETGYASLFHRMTPPARQLGRLLSHLGSTPPDFVLISGDLTEGGNAEDYAVLRGLLEDAFPGVPLCLAMGNHDSREAFRRGWLGECGDDAPFHRLYRIQGAAVLSLDSSCPGVPHGRIDSHGLQWLRSALDHLGDAPCILMTHHHLRHDQSDMPPAEGADALAEVLQESRVRAVLCGHTHRSYAGLFAGKPYHATGSLSFCAEPRERELVFLERSAAHLCRWTGEGVSVSSIPVLPAGKILWTTPLHL